MFALFAVTVISSEIAGWQQSAA